MVKQIVTDVFETLGQQTGQAVQQVAEESGKLIETASGQVGTKPVLTSQEIAARQNKAVEEKQATARRLNYLEAELNALRQKEEQKEKQVAAKSEEKEIKQLEIKKEEKKEELPAPIAAVKKKGPERKQLGGG